jgi:hypothetical protein
MKTLKTKLLVFVTILMLGMTAAAPAFSADCIHPGHGYGRECRNEAISDNTDGINDNAARIEQVNKEDMRVKSGTVNGNTLRLRVEDMAATPGRSAPYGKDVNIDVSSLRGNDGVDGKDGFGTQADLDRVETRIEQVNQEDHRAVGGSLNNGTLTINTEDMDGGSKRTFTVDGDFNAESKANQLDIETNRSRIEQVNLEDQRLKDGEVNANGDLVLYTEDQPDGQSRRAATVDGFKTNVTDKIAENENMNNAQDEDLSDHNGRIGQNEQDIAENEGRLDDNDVTNSRQDNAIGNNAQGVADNESMNNAQNKVLRDHNGRIGANTTAISNVHGYTVDNRRDIDLNAYGIETNRRAIVDTNARIDGVMNDMRYLDRNLSAGIASAVAMGQHNFDPTYQGGQVSIAGGHFNGANAVSLAVGVPAGSNAFFSLSAAANDGPGNESIGMGLTYRLP